MGDFMKNKNVAVFILAVAIVIVVYISIAIHINTNNQNNVKVQTTSSKSSYVITKTTTTILKTPKNSTTRKTTKQTTKKSVANKTKTNNTAKKVINFPIDINKATVEELMQIKNIGEVTANKIIEYRNSVGVISNLDLLLNVNGIGEATLNNLKQYLYISDDVYQEMTQSTTTAPVETKTSRVTTTTHREYQPVNINKASAKEISDCLLIDMSLAREIIDLRNKISYFSNLNELFYIDNFPKEIYDTRKNYILI